MSIQLGIDLGTTNSVVSCFRKGQIEVIPIEGKNTFPSVLSVRGREIVVGSIAKSRLLLDPRNTISSTKRDIGTNKVYSIGNMPFTPEDVAYYILRTIKEKSEEYLSEEVKDAVVTVPAYFTSEQREATKKAAIRAGFNVLRLIPEPTAAALDYGIDQDNDQILMVYDLGGGTFDISIMKVNGNDFEVLAVDGDSHLGGDDFDDALSQLIINKVNKDLNLSITLQKDRKYLGVVTKIKEASERAKIELSDMEETYVLLPNLIDDYCLDMTITRAEFNKSIEPLINKTLEKINSALASINISKSNIDRVILVGGSTKIPLIKEVVTEKVKEPYMAVNVDEVVSRGAAIMAASLYSPSDEEASYNKSNIILEKNINVIEKTVFTYGIDLLNDYGELFFNPIVPRGSKLPATGGIIASTSKPYQEQVVIGVYRGESRNIYNNDYLGKIVMKIKRVSPHAIPVLALFEIDENMIIRFISAEIPLENYYLSLVRENNISLLRYCVERGEFNSKEVKIDARDKKSGEYYG